jgi:hypothetical protein
MNTFLDEFGTTTIGPSKTVRRMSIEDLKAGGWRDMNRSGLHGEWRRTLVNTDTRHVQEVYSTRGTITKIEWKAAC